MGAGLKKAKVVPKLEIEGLLVLEITLCSKLEENLEESCRIRRERSDL
jgi:hypothetical protein